MNEIRFGAYADENTVNLSRVEDISENTLTCNNVRSLCFYVGISIEQLENELGFDRGLIER